MNKTLVGIHGLLQHYDTQIDIDVAKDAVLVTTGTAVLRQAIISILSRLVIQSTPNSHFAVSFWDDGAEGHFAFECVERSDQACLPQLLAEQMAILHSLMRVIGGRVEESSASSEAYHISLHFPLHKSTLLVIDDNPDAIALFQRFASGQPYQIMAAYDGTQALQLAQEASPALIILDVLLPQQDGWEILQTLKSHPLTSHIPVLICSVLDLPELARVLGADGFLRKPPNEAEFLDTLAFFCPIGDSIKNNVVGR